MRSDSTTAFEELHRAFVFHGRCACAERAEITTLARFWILLARVEPILSVFQLADHNESPSATLEVQSNPVAILRPAAQRRRRYKLFDQNTAVGQDDAVRRDVVRLRRDFDIADYP